MTAIDQLRDSWLEGLSRNAQADGWTLLTQYAITDREQFRAYLLALERVRGTRRDDYEGYHLRRETFQRSVR